MMPPYLFDSHALLAFFQNEKGAEVVARILKKTLSASFVSSTSEKSCM